MTKTLTEQQIRKILENGTLKAAKVCEKKFYGKPKSLTEQWRDGELKDGSFYIERLGKYMRANCIGTVLYLENHDVIWSPTTVEIIAPVPSYDEWQAELDSNNELLNVQKRLENKIKLLEEQLNYALETMGQVAMLSDNMVDSVQCAHAICLINERLKEMEGVKRQKLK